MGEGKFTVIAWILVAIILGGAYKAYNIYSGHTSKPAVKDVHKPAKGGSLGTSVSPMPSLVSIGLWR